MIIVRILANFIHHLRVKIMKSMRNSHPMRLVREPGFIYACYLTIRVVRDAIKEYAMEEKCILKEEEWEEDGC